MVSLQASTNVEVIALAAQKTSRLAARANHFSKLTLAIGLMTFVIPLLLDRK